MKRVALLVPLVFFSLAAPAQAQPLEPLPPPTTQPPATQPPATQPLPPPTSPEAPTVEDFGRPAPRPVQDLGPAPPLPDESKKFHESVKGELGYEYAQVHGVPIDAGRLILGFGGQNADMAHYAIATMMLGQTREGRRVWDLRVGWSGDLYRAGILRLGLTAQAGYLVVRRVTDDSRAYAFGIGAGGHAGVDLVPFGDHGEHALTLDGRFDVHLHFGNAVQWGPEILLGFRW